MAGVRNFIFGRPERPAAAPQQAPSAFTPETPIVGPQVNHGGTILASIARAAQTRTVLDREDQAAVGADGPYSRRTLG